MCPPLEKVKTKGAPKKSLTKQQKSTKCNPSYWEYVDALHLFKIDSIENIIDVKANGNCGYHAIATLLGVGEESWSLVHNHLHKELTSWSEEYINLLGGIKKFEELKCFLLVDGLSMAHKFIVTINKWMNITNMGYVIVSRYNVSIVFFMRSLSFTTIGVVVEYTLSISSKAVTHPIHSDRPYVAYALICDLQLVDQCSFLRCSNILQQQYRLLFLRDKFSLINFWMWLYDNLNVLVYDAYVLKMDEDQWRYDFAMSQEVHMDYDYDNQEECGVNESHVDCSNAFNTSQVFATRNDVLPWPRIVAHENGFVAVIMRSDTETGSR
ncbi:hypothetical protein GmHk_12G034679 [Glycine max]|nr:hypothetical protein GmHk_12G034679 [Glycine max]KAH1221203.1 hypothetical protein GmHk_12G034679 [Glycine max]KAH1221205.1 hypothetical protein GmHk_12G034679 [Glycine max]